MESSSGGSTIWEMGVLAGRFFLSLQVVATILATSMVRKHIGVTFDGEDAKPSPLTHREEDRET